MFGEKRTEMKKVLDSVSLAANNKATVSGGLSSLLPMGRRGYRFNRGWR
jgi:hypothetical protein